MFIKKEYEQWVVKMESGLEANEYFVCKLGCFEPELVLVLQYGVIESRFTTSEILEIQSEVFNVVKSYCDMGHDVLWTGDMNLHVGNKGKLGSNNPTQSNGGKNLMKFIELENLHLCNWEDPSPTHIDRSGGQNNILDLMITNVRDKITNFKVDTDLKFSPT